MVWREPSKVSQEACLRATRLPLASRVNPADYHRHCERFNSRQEAQKPALKTVSILNSWNGLYLLNGLSSSRRMRAVDIAFA